MNYNLLILALLVVFACQSSQIEEDQVLSTEKEQPEMTYDSVKAVEYGADQYGMRKYVMAFLKKGPNRDLDSAKSVELQTAHLQNIGRMADEGKLALAGPFFGDGETRGIYIFAVESIEEAETLTNSDPAIQAGSLVMELKEWYGSAALMAVNDIHNTLAREGIVEDE